MFDGRAREVSIEGLRFRLFLEQMCRKYANGRPINGKGVQKNVQDFLGKRPNGKNVLPQSQMSQYLRDRNPKVAQSPMIERVMRAFEKKTKQRIAWAFFHDPAIVNPHYEDFLEPLIGARQAPAAAPEPGSSAPKPRAPALMVLDYAAERGASPSELRRFRETLERNGLADDPQPRELETVFNEVVRRRSAEEHAAAERNAGYTKDRKARGITSARDKPRPAKKRKRAPRKKKAPRNRDSDSPNLFA